MGASHAALTNVTGDDVVISSFVEDDLLEDINEGIVNILKDCAENLGDLSGISDNADDAGEGISYAEAKFRDGFYPDAIILGFDTSILIPTTTTPLIYPYFFVNLETQGVSGVLMWIGIISAAFVVMGYAFLGLDRILKRKNA